MLFVLIARSDLMGPGSHYTFLSIQTCIPAHLCCYPCIASVPFPHISQPCIMPHNIRSTPTMCPKHIVFHFQDPHSPDCSLWSCWSPLTMPNFFSLTRWLIRAIIIILAPLRCEMVAHGHRIIPCPPIVRREIMMPIGIIYIQVIRLALPQFELVFDIWDMVYIAMKD